VHEQISGKKWWLSGMISIMLISRSQIAFFFFCAFDTKRKQRSIAMQDYQQGNVKKMGGQGISISSYISLLLTLRPK